MKKSVTLIALLWIVTLATAAPPSPVDLLMIAADNELLQPFINRLENPQIEQHKAWTIWTGSLAGKSVALTRSEGDPLNAVAATTLAIRLHAPRLIFVYGLARPHDRSLHAGDLVLSERFVAFDGMVSPQKPLGAGSDPLTWQKLPHLLMTEGENEVPAESFPADKGALALAQRLAQGKRPFRTGVLGSAPQINREADRIAWVHDQWKTSTEDGESADIAGCAALFHVPVFGARIVGDSPKEIVAFASEFLNAWK